MSGPQLMVEVDTDGIITGAAIIQSVTLTAAGAACTVSLYDAAAAAGTPTFQLKAPASDSRHAHFPDGARYGTGLSAKIDPAGARAIITIA